MVDRVWRVFILAVLALATLTAVFGIWGRYGTTGNALFRSITILVIACPCALGIATPLLTTAAVGAASRRGILVGDRRGNYSQLDVYTENFGILASLEQYSEHPLGQAVVRRANQLNLGIDIAENVEVLKGTGIRGDVQGKQFSIGNRSLVGEVPEAILRRAVE